MKFLAYLLVFVIGGAVGFFVGEIRGGVATSAVAAAAGADIGVCTAVKVANDKGMLTPEQQNALLAATAVELRTEVKDLDKVSKLFSGETVSEGIDIDAEACAKTLKAINDSTS